MVQLLPKSSSWLGVWRSLRESSTRGAFATSAKTVGTVFLLIAITSVDGAATALDAYRQHLSAVPTAFEIEFEEGNIHSSEPPKVEQVASMGKNFYVLRRPAWRYVARCQQDAFWVEDQMDLPELSSRTRMLAGIGNPRRGYYGKIAWQSQNSNIVTLYALSPTDETQTNTPLAAIRRHEKSTWTAYYLGLPRLRPNSIKWETAQFEAETYDGLLLKAQLSLHESSSIIKEVHYRCINATGDCLAEGLVKYSYDPQASVHPLPAALDHQTRLAATPEEAARANRSIRILRLERFDAPLTEGSFHPPGGINSPQVRGMRSNGVFLSKTKSGQFVYLPPSIPNGQGEDFSRAVRIFVLVAMASVTILAAAFLAFRLKKHTKHPKMEEENE